MREYSQLYGEFSNQLSSIYSYIIQSFVPNLQAVAPLLIADVMSTRCCQISSRCCQFNIGITLKCKSLASSNVNHLLLQMRYLSFHLLILHCAVNNVSGGIQIAYSLLCVPFFRSTKLTPLPETLVDGKRQIFYQVRISHFTCV